ncbi:MAG: WXG100 family type VII secretion target [Propionibacteriaceae bacterium]|nr:WXG100 family type VII secretion target [Propionibacteriaceae bacterium]
MSGDIRVSFAAIQNLSSEMNGSSQEIQGTLDQLESEIEGKLLANWDGDAQQSYRSAKAQWDADAEEMNAILAEMSLKTDEAGVQYQATEAANAARFDV